jgi:hypothetical protein
VWADNADGLSIPYSGTGALKTDYTRYAIITFTINKTNLTFIYGSM